MLGHSNNQVTQLKEKQVAQNFTSFADAADAVEELLEARGLGSVKGEPDVFTAIRHNDQVNSNGDKLIDAIIFIGFTPQEIIAELQNPWQ